MESPSSETWKTVAAMTPCASLTVKLRGRRIMSDKCPGAYAIAEGAKLAAFTAIVARATASSASFSGSAVFVQQASILSGVSARVA